MSTACAVGLAPHSGWAVAVVIGGTARNPSVLVRARLEMTDAALPGCRQPYHALEGLPLAEARTALARFESSATALATQGLTALRAEARSAGAHLGTAAILESSGRACASLEATLASHALVHTADGNHFRAALVRGCESLGIKVVRLPQRSLSERAAATFRRTPEELAAQVAQLGRALGAPWGADQKSAALCGWLLLGS